MDLNYFDLVASIIILFLGLKGIINGFFKELFGLLGIVGGIFIASRVGDSVGQKISDLIFNFQNSAAIGFTGFLVTLAAFWLIMLGAGLTFKKLSSMSGLGALDKILGFIFGASKFFLIASVIAYSVYNIKAVRSSIDSNLNNSIVFPAMVEIGGFIMKIDPIEISDDVTSTINKTIESSTQAIVEETKNQLKEQLKEGKQ